MRYKLSVYQFNRKYPKILSISRTHGLAAARLFQITLFNIEKPHVAFSVRAVTSVGQQLPHDWEEKVELFKCYVNEKKQGVELMHIGNFDEVPMSFDLPGNFTVDIKDAENVKITTTGSEKCNFTVALCVTADGSKLPPFVIFKRKTIPKENYPKGIIIQANEKGWMNQDMVKIWINKVWIQRKSSFFKPKSLLVLDSAPSHRTDEIKSLIKKHSEIAMILGGLTKKLQPLDISINKSFKSKIRTHWQRYMIEQFKLYNQTNKIKKASYSEVCNWIVQSWNEITINCIKNGFQKAMIHSYDNLIYEEVSMEVENENISIPDDIGELLNTINIDSDDSDIEGFDFV